MSDMARLLRKKSRYVIANGACAHIGGVIGLANLHRPEEALQRALYRCGDRFQSIRNDSGIRSPFQAASYPGP